MKATSLFHLQTSWFVVLLSLTLVLSGCARTPPVTLYQLSAINAGQPAVDAKTNGAAVIGISAVRLPDFLDRPQIVIRAGANQLQLIEGHRWAEPLAESISRTLRENLAFQLNTERILRYPWSQTTSVDYQILVEILHFEGEGYKEAHLAAIWSIQGRKGKILLPQRRADFQIAASQPNCEGLVQALSQTLSLFCREIAGAVLKTTTMDKL